MPFPGFFSGPHRIGSDFHDIALQARPHPQRAQMSQYTWHTMLPLGQPRAALYSSLRTEARARPSLYRDRQAFETAFAAKSFSHLRSG